MDEPNTVKQKTIGWVILDSICGVQKNLKFPIFRFLSFIESQRGYYISGFFLSQLSWRSLNVRPSLQWREIDIIAVCEKISFSAQIFSFKDPLFQNLPRVEMSIGVCASSITMRIYNSHIYRSIFMRMSKDELFRKLMFRP